MSHTQPCFSSAVSGRLVWCAIPRARRLPLVEQIHGRTVADPYRWLEDPATPRRVAWSGAQDALARADPGRVIRAGRRSPSGCGDCCGPARRARRCPRCGSDFGSGAAPEQQHPVVVVGALDDPANFRTLARSAADRPVRHDHAGRLGALAGRPAARVSALQPEATRSRRCRCWTSRPEASSTARSTAPATPPSPGCPTGAASTTCAACARTARSTAGSTCTGSATIRRRTPTSSAKAATRARYFGVDLSPDGRWLVVSAAIGTAPRDDVWIAELHRSRRRFAVVQEGVDARCHAAVAFDGRLYVWTDAGAPRGRLCVADPADPQRMDDAGRRGPRGRARRLRRAGRARSLLAYSRHAVGEVRVVARENGAVQPPRRPSRHRQRARRHRVAGRRERSLDRLHRRAHPAGGARRATAGSGRPLPGEVPVDRHHHGGRDRRPAPTARRSGCRSSRRPASRARCPPCSTATAASASAWNRRTRRPRWPGCWPAGCGWSRSCAAAARRARPGTAPGCARTSRTSSPISRRPPATCAAPDGRRTLGC